MKQVTSETELAAWLQRFHVDYATWGRLPGTKRLANLLIEIQQGDCRLEERADQLVRLVKVINVDVTCQDERLIEFEQRFHDDRGVRRRNLDTSVAEKFGMNEEPIHAAHRGLAEEIGLTVDLALTPLGIEEQEQSSKSYPSLSSVYWVHRFHVELTPEQKALVRLEEVQKDKTTVFKWIPNPRQ